MPADAAQLALPVHLRDDATLENFLFDESTGPLSIALLEQLAAAGEPALYLHGPTGSGRTHLLQGACHAAPAGESLYLPLTQFSGEDAEAVIAGVEDLARVCLDDIDAVAGDSEWELALFNLVNRARETGCRLLFSADCAPRELALSLPDLRSRLSWSVVFQLRAPGDERKLEILKFRAGRRGMGLSDEAARYILSRAPRGMTDLMDVVERLDRDSIVAKRSLTIPFIRDRMDW